MNKKQYIIIGTVAILVIVGVVLGVVFGLRAADDNSSTDKSNQAGGLATSSDATEAPSLIVTSVQTSAPVTSLTPAPVSSTPVTLPPETSFPGTQPPATSIPATSAPTSTIQALLEPLVLMGGQEFDDSSSYQRAALTWLEANPGPSSDNADSLLQRYALACFFINTYNVTTVNTEFEYSGATTPGWIDTTSWMTNDDECTWFGIVCNDQGFVNVTDLGANDLTGRIPNEIVLLKDYLVYLDISYNVITNVDEDLDWIGQLTNLETLLFGSCWFQYDGIPPFLTNLKQLRDIDLSYTVLHGDVRPEVWAQLTNLEYLEMGGNAYNTTIPLEIASLPNLDSLYLENSYMSGDLSFMDNMTVIFELWLDSNFLTGTIPESIGLRTTLASLSLTSCEITGTIPTTMGLLTDMKQLWLFDNMLTGTVPTELGLMTDMSILQVEANDLTGSIPADLCTLRNDVGGPLETLSADCQTRVTSEVTNNTAKIGCACCTCCMFPCS